jgi:hypothetical protein
MTVQKLPTPESGSKVYSDDSLPNFAVRVRNTGTKTFILTLGTERKRLTLGRYGVVTLAQAREKARKILAERELGIEPKTSPTFKEVLHEYLDRRAAEVRASTRQADSYHFKLCEGLERRRIDEIGPKDIQAVIDKAGGPSTKRSAYIRLSGLFSYAVRIGYLDRSPVKALEIPPDQDRGNSPS